MPTIQSVKEMQTETRVAVLEQIAITHDKRISDMEDFHRDVVDRLDQKIQLDANNQVALERTLTRAVVSLDALNNTVQVVGTNAEEAISLVRKHETIAATLIKVAGASALIISALWTLFIFFR